MSLKIILSCNGKRTEHSKDKLRNAFTINTNYKARHGFNGKKTNLFLKAAQVSGEMRVCPLIGKS